MSHSRFSPRFFIRKNVRLPSLLLICLLLQLLHFIGEAASYPNLTSNAPTTFKEIGGTALFYCQSSTSFLTNESLWYKDGEVIDFNDSNLHLYPTRDSRDLCIKQLLSIIEVRRSDNGTYACRPLGRGTNLSNPVPLLVVEPPRIRVLNDVKAYLTNEETNLSFPIEIVYNGGDLTLVLCDPLKRETAVFLVAVLDTKNVTFPLNSDTLSRNVASDVSWLKDDNYTVKAKGSVLQHGWVWSNQFRIQIYHPRSPPVVNISRIGPYSVELKLEANKEKDGFVYDNILKYALTIWNSWSQHPARTILLKALPKWTNFSLTNLSPCTPYKMNASLIGTATEGFQGNVYNFTTTFDETKGKIAWRTSKGEIIASINALPLQICIDSNLTSYQKSLLCKAAKRASENEQMTIPGLYYQGTFVFPDLVAENERLEAYLPPCMARVDHCKQSNIASQHLLCADDQSGFPTALVASLSSLAFATVVIICVWAYKKRRRLRENGVVGECNPIDTPLYQRGEANGASSRDSAVSNSSPLRNSEDVSEQRNGGQKPEDASSLASQEGQDYTPGRQTNTSPVSHGLGSVNLIQKADQDGEGLSFMTANETQPDDKQSPAGKSRLSNGLPASDHGEANNGSACDGPSDEATRTVTIKDLKEFEDRSVARWQESQDLITETSARREVSRDNDETPPESQPLPLIAPSYPCSESSPMLSRVSDPAQNRQSPALQCPHESPRPPLPLNRGSLLTPVSCTSSQSSDRESRRGFESSSDESMTDPPLLSHDKAETSHPMGASNSADSHSFDHYDDPNECPSEIQLWELSASLVKCWKGVGRHLGLSEDTIQCICKDEEKNAREQAYQMLISWRNQGSKVATKKSLKEALDKEKLGLLGEQS